MLIDHVTVTFAHASGLSRDQVVNTWTFTGEADLTDTGFGTIESALTDFYNGTDTGGTGLTVASFLGPQLSRSVVPVFRHYDLDGHLSGGALGSPQRVQPMVALGAGNGGTGLPSEVACCLSFNGAYGSDPEFGPGGATRPRARDRGRIYLGPLSASGCISIESTTQRPKVSDNLRETVVAAALRLSAFAGLPAFWSTWSRKAGTTHQVVDVAVDDAFDTQRRRGERANIRTTAAVP